ncbi:hypothetical protein PILCRDRAFT_121498 [Piloderma croceum F 1598]|uniref:Uncharacterized protein n=1 Tax=Piloderma croceum (strain F 1598) TaxID=765440 RepID=A0A0C3GLC3_PILCF|nr:hypothetical protein PILCRDRAFT_121498 [Piloderma croceum F 1598]
MSGRRSSFKNVTAKADLAVYLALLYGKPGGIFHDNLPCKNEDLPLLPQTELTDNVSLFKMVRLTGALAAICVYKDHAQVFALTVGVLVDGSNSQDVFLHLAENTEVSESVIKHLHDIWRLLIDLRDSPDHSTAPISLAIYHHSFLKFRRRFKKRQYLFFEIYTQAIIQHVSSSQPTQKKLFFTLLSQLRGLQNAVDSPVKTEAVQRTFSAVCALHQQWKPYLDDPSPKSLFLEWDNVAGMFISFPEQIVMLIHRTEDANIQFSLRRYLGKLFTLHEHSLAICEIVFRKELAPLLGGTLVIVPIPPDKPNITLNLTEGHARALILDVASGLKEMDSHVVYEAVISKLMSKTARNNLLCSPLHDISFKGTVHCESNLLAFHHQHRLPDTINFIACSKLSSFLYPGITQHLILRLGSPPLGRSGPNRATVASRLSSYPIDSR